MPSRDTRAVIDTGAIQHNASALAKMVEPAQLIAVVKADGYGHGAVQAAQAALAGGAASLAVATAEEGALLRGAGIDCDILVMGPTSPEGASITARNGLIQSLYAPDVLLWMEQAARIGGKVARAHIKVQTGMNRIGVDPTQIDQLLALAARCSNVRIEGIFSHLADFTNRDFSRKQGDVFLSVAGRVAAQLGPLKRHLLGSGGALTFPELRLEAVRCGIALYGYPPALTKVPLRRALSLYSEIAQIHEVAQGESIGYGCSYQAQQDMRVAAVPIGYGDGYPRGVGNRGYVLVQGQRAPVVGRVCMDQCMIDVTQVYAAAVGDEVVLIGAQGKESITADHLAIWCDTIPYEILLRPTTRVPREYRP